MTRRGWTAWAAAVLLLVAAGAMRAVTPDSEARTAPFPVTAAVGETGVGRDLAVTVTGATRAARLTADDFDVAANWLVVDLEAAAVVAEPASLGSATFEIDGLTYAASDRFTSFLLSALRIDLPSQGTVAFELAPGITSGAGVLSFSSSADPRLDSVIEVPLDLGTLPHVAAAAIADPSGVGG